MPHGVLFRGGAEARSAPGCSTTTSSRRSSAWPPTCSTAPASPPASWSCAPRAPNRPNGPGRCCSSTPTPSSRPGGRRTTCSPSTPRRSSPPTGQFADIPGYATVVTREELAANDDNLNIRRYADNAPPPEPQDVRAHLHGGVPAGEVDAKAPLFTAHGFSPERIFTGRDDAYLDFSQGVAKADLKARVTTDEGVQAREAELRAALDRWWEQHAILVADLPATKSLMKVRRTLLESFIAELLPVGLLDRFQVAGVIVRWWNNNQYDLAPSSPTASPG